MKEIIFAIGMLLAHDGDTVCSANARSCAKAETYARVWGLDCPELSTYAGTLAKRQAQAWLDNNTLTCVDTGRASFNRKVYRCDAFARHMILYGGCREWCGYSKGYYGGKTCAR